MLLLLSCNYDIITVAIEMWVSNEETKLHRNSRDFRDLYKKGKPYYTSFMIWGIKQEDNRHDCNHEVIKRGSNGNILLPLSLLLFITTKVAFGNIQRSCRIIEIKINNSGLECNVVSKKTLIFCIGNNVVS